EGERPEVLGLLRDDERFKLPQTMIDQLGTVPGQPWVRIVGEVHAQETGETLTVRDGTGQVMILTAQPEALPARSKVEVIGRPATADLGWTLTESLFRRVGTAENQADRTLRGPGQAPVRLRLAEQVVQLPPEEADKRYPVTLRGVVTWFDERADHLYLQDASGGVRVRRPPGDARGLSFGNAVTMSGVTVRGALLPEVELLESSDQGSFALPTPRRINLEQALSGVEESRWVEMRGFVRQVSSEGGWTRLDLTEATGEFSAYLPRDDSLGRLQAAMVRIRGVSVSQPARGQERPGMRLWVQNGDAVVVEVPGTADPFGSDLQTIPALRRLTFTQPLNQRVRVKGVVSLHQVGRYLYLQDGEAGLFVLSREATAFAPGEWVEVSGIPGRAGNRLVLREGLLRKAAGDAPLVPVALTGFAAVDVEHDVRLVRLNAVVRQAVDEGTRWGLSLEVEGKTFEATLPLEANWSAPDAGSGVELTGVYVVEYDEYRQPHGFRLELRSPRDIRVTAQPPWWNARRTLYVMGAVCVVTLLIASWGITLRRRVSAQTEQIRQQLEREKQLQGEIDRSARLESLGVLAGGIAHDFNNLLTAILGNLGLAAMDKRVMAAAGDCISEAERGARRARDITHQLLTFAKGGEPVRTAVLLPDIVSEAANFARHGSNVRLDFDYPPDLPPGNVDAGQISRVVHNIVINAVQAMPDGGVVSIELVAVNVAAGEVDTLPPGPYLRLSIA
ncbi:MAG TPA: histidine kinase dimerization/phospho-acceptor domain-containing protein, partial [Lacunisphaera sp.]|nr:histidine kinase dimerization/phospho-acceptor domain-containing protein [Lacunisphaera sp.]